MNKTAAQTAITACLREIRDCLAAANATSDAALVCAEKGNFTKAIEIALDIEQPMYDASRLLDAASLLRRLATEAAGIRPHA
jgi:hypothetical protein